MSYFLEMMQNKSIYRLFIVGLMAIYTSFAFGQTQQESLTSAKQFMLKKQYADASKIYAELLANDSNNIAITELYANSIRLQLNYTKANHYYSKVIKSPLAKDFPESYFYYAVTSKQMGKYQEAIKGFYEYIKHGKSNHLRSQSEQEIEACKYAINHKNDSSIYEVSHLPPPVNTPYSEFNPVLLSGNEMVFSRYQPVFQDSIESVFGQAYYGDIFITKQNQQGWQKAKLFSKQISSNKYFTANICFSRNKQEIYFTRCIDEDGIIGRCAIYTSKRQRGKWSRPKKLDSKINVQNYSSTHPYLAEYEDYKVLYFSSNMPNGFGKSDIFYAIIKNDHIEQVSNLGSTINTSGDELTPFYDPEQSILYFSSDTHKGFGGFDIFKSSGALSSWSQVSNMGMPVNSPANDLYYTHRRVGEEAYLSSNRKGSFFHNNVESCCGDIYMAIRKEEITKTDSTPSITTDTTAVAIRKLLPLSLYFENDMPDPRSIKTSTKHNYKVLLDEYVQAEDTYKEEYSRGLNDEAAQIAKQQIEDFFIEEVKRGLLDLEKFAQLLKTELEKGKNVRIKIKGYASPLNNASYNLALSKRRISSLINYIREYEQGYFISYFETPADNGGQLHIFENPLGDSQSKGMVSDNPNDKRNSVYSREAALQRKIQIIMYSSDEERLDSSEYPILQWQKDSISFGSIEKGKNKSGILYFKNIGTSELKIQHIVSDCKCLQVQTEKETYQSQENGKLYILVRTNDLIKGEYRVKISLQTNEIEGLQNYWIHFEVK